VFDNKHLNALNIKPSFFNNSSFSLAFHELYFKISEISLVRCLLNLKEFIFLPKNNGIFFKKLPSDQANIGQYFKKSCIVPRNDGQNFKKSWIVPGNDGQFFKKSWIVLGNDGQFFKKTWIVPGNNWQLFQKMLPVFIS